LSDICAKVREGGKGRSRGMKIVMINKMFGKIIWEKEGKDIKVHKE
jgi:hypothetical protein